MGKPTSCVGCPLEVAGTGFVVDPYGSGSTGVLLLGEALGSEEVEAGRQFAGRAGSVLDRLITRTKDPLTGAPFAREDFWTANVLQCQPPGNELTGAPYEREAIAHCRPNLEGVLRDLRPRAIVALGNQPLRWLTGYWGIEHWRGSVLESPWGWVIPSFHPSYIMRGNFHLSTVWINDLLRAVRIARDGVPSQPLDYLLDPLPQVFQDFISEWRALGRPPLAFDIETLYSAGADEDALEEIHLEETLSYQIMRISFAFREGHAVTVPFSPPFREMVIALLNEAPLLTVWNENFDVPRLQAAGANFTGQIFDSMQLFHRLYPALPYNLQFATSLLWGDTYKAWKHLSGSEPEWYSAHDSATLLRNFNLCREKAIQTGAWDIFIRHFVEIGRITRKMSKHGIQVNQANRLAARTKFQGQLSTLQESAQGLIPVGLKPKHVYKKPWEQIEKQLGPQDPAGWIQVSVPLTEKEQQRLHEKEARRAAKALEAEAKRLAKAAKKKEGAGRKRKKKEGGVSE